MNSVDKPDFRILLCSSDGVAESSAFFAVLNMWLDFVYRERKFRVIHQGVLVFTRFFKSLITSPTGSSVMQDKGVGDLDQFAGPTVDEEAELKELEFRARALESLVRARERQMKIEKG